MENARQYLDKIYAGQLDFANNELMEFYAEAYSHTADLDLLEFGGGPAIYSIITAARTCRDIHFADPSKECLTEIRDWLNNKSGAFDWTNFVMAALGYERPTETVTCKSIEERERLVRSKVWRVSACDAFSPEPLLGLGRAHYGVVASNFCLEGITSSRAIWWTLCQRLFSLVDSKGHMITTAIRNGSFWGVGTIKKAATPLTMNDLIDAYRRLDMQIVATQELALEDRSGYDGILMVHGRRQ